MRLLIAFLMLTVSLTVSVAQEEEPPWAGMQQQLIPLGLPIGPWNSTFISHFALNGDTAFVSKADSSHSGYSALGVVTVFRRIDGNWIQQESILPPEEDRRNYLLFGRQLSTDGDYLTIAAQECFKIPIMPHVCTSHTRVYIYRRNGLEWVLDGKILDIPDIAGEHVVPDGVFVAGETVVVNGSRKYREPDFDFDIEGDIFFFNRIDGIWTLTNTLLDEPSNNRKWNRAVGLSQDGNSLLLLNMYWMHIFRQTDAGWELSALIKAPYRGRPPLAALNDRGDTAAVLWSWGDQPDRGPQYALYIYHFNGSEWELVYTTPKLWHEPTTIAFTGDTLAVGSGHLHYEDSLSVARVYREIDGQWKQYSVLPIYRTPLPDEWIVGEGSMMAIDGDYVLTNMHIAYPDASDSYEIWALTIPGVEQDVPQTVGGQNTPNALPLPDAPSDYRDAAPSDYSVFHAALKTRPTKSVKLRLTTNGDALLDVGGVASTSLTLKFTRDNWNIPQEVRVRLAPNQWNAPSTIVREEIVGESAHEYKLIKAAKVRVNVPPTAFVPESPTADAILPNDAPVTFTWRPYSLATHYVVKLERIGGTRVLKVPVDPAAACTVDLCTLTLDRAALPKGKALKWRVVAQDQPAAYQRATPWRRFTFIAPQ